MISRVVQSVSFFVLLRALDEKISGEYLDGVCPQCGGPLHRASYQRKGVGAAPLQEGGAREATRYGLCCGHCRCRQLPPSVMFLGRRVYMYPAILLATMMCQGRRSSRTKLYLRRHLGVDGKTIKRWVEYFRDGFVRTKSWQRVRGFLGSKVCDDALPRSLLVFFWREFGRGESGLVRCLCFLATGQVEVTVFEGGDRTRGRWGLSGGIGLV